MVARSLLGELVAVGEEEMMGDAYIEVAEDKPAAVVAVAVVAADPAATEDLHFVVRLDIDAIVVAVPLALAASVEVEVAAYEADDG